MPKVKKNLWKKGNGLERTLIVIIVLLLCLVVALLVILLLRDGPVLKSDTAAVCTSPACLKAAALIVDYIDPSVDPCDDFYKFACGTFMKSAFENDEITPVTKLDTITENRLKALIVEPTTKPALFPLDLERRFYQSCMNTAEIEDDDSQTILGLIEELGGWPVIKGRLWDERKFYWVNATIKCRELGIFYYHFLTIDRYPDNNNETGLFILWIRQTFDEKVENKFRESYVELMTNIALELGAPATYTSNEFNKVLNFKEQLDKISEEAATITTDTKLTIRELSQKFPRTPWLQFLSGITRSVVDLDENTAVRVVSEQYLRDLDSLLSRTPKKDQANYIIWKIVNNYSNYLGKDIRDHYNKYLAYRYAGSMKHDDRQSICLRKTKPFFRNVAEIAYVRKYTPEEVRRDVKEIVIKIKQQIIMAMKSSDWMDEDTKKEAEIRLNRIQHFVGWSDAIFEKDLDELTDLQGLEFPTDNIIDMIRTLNVRTNDNFFRGINRNFSEVSKGTVEASPTLIVNAFYSIHWETLILPASVLQGRFYGVNRPRYMNYGALGSVIGHEFTHGLAAQESWNDEEEIETWWSSETADNFKNKSQCLVEQYDNYTAHLEGFAKNGSVALDENFADFLGPNLAYRAYQEWVAEKGPEPTLPGVNYTSNQIFWIMFGTFKCYQPKPGRQQLRPDATHGVPSFGVSGSLRNSPHFAADFNCPLGSNMNPADKCRIL